MVASQERLSERFKLMILIYLGNLGNWESFGFSCLVLCGNVSITLSLVSLYSALSSILDVAITIFNEENKITR